MLFKAWQQLAPTLNCSSAVTGPSSSYVDGNSSNAGLIQDFVARSGTHFVVQARNGSKDSCETFYFAGANTYYLVSLEEYFI
jgi:hypothetical protein